MTQVDVLVSGESAPVACDRAQSGFARAAAARANDGSFALIHLPSARKIAVELGRLAGPEVYAAWFDPAQGTYAAVPGSPFAAVGSQRFLPDPVENGSGFDDWILVLRSRAVGSLARGEDHVS